VLISANDGEDGLNTETYMFSFYNKGKGQLDWNIKVSDSWIQIDKVKGSTVCEERIWVSVDWSKVLSFQNIFLFYPYSQ